MRAEVWCDVRGGCVVVAAVKDDVQWPKLPTAAGTEEATLIGEARIQRSFPLPFATDYYTDSIS
jgi:hypothetical protein